MTIDRTKSFFRNQSGNSVPYIVDQPQISIAPHGQASMGRTFMIEGVGLLFLSQAVTSSYNDVKDDEEWWWQ